MNAIYHALRAYLDAESGQDTAGRAHLPALLSFERQNRGRCGELDSLAARIAETRSVRHGASFAPAAMLGASTTAMLHDVLNTPSAAMPRSTAFRAVLDTEDTTGLLNIALERLVVDFCERVDGACVAGFAGRVTRQGARVTRTPTGLRIEASLSRLNTPLRATRTIGLEHPSRTSLLESRGRGIAVMNEIRALGEVAGGWPLFLASEILSLRRRTLA